MAGGHESDHGERPSSGRSLTDLGEVRGQSVEAHELADHWENFHAKTPSTEASWYEREPTTSLRLIEKFAPGTSGAVLDIGAGASLLVDRLLTRGFTDLTVLDIARHALDEVEERLGEGARHVRFVVSDVLAWQPDRRYDIWHDRAVFHFLTDPAARDRYVDTAGRGFVPVARWCSRRSPTTARRSAPVCPCPGTRLMISRRRSRRLLAIDFERNEHVTPGGAVQPFTWVILRRTSPPLAAH